MNPIEDKFCQSCAMPMGITDEHYGSEADGSKSDDYCSYCYSGGEFKKDVTMKEMLELCVGFAVDGVMTEKQARRKLERVLPALRRWAVSDDDSEDDSDSNTDE
jgi:hypothetical protein